VSETDPHSDTPTLTDFERYAKGADAIQKGCACRAWNPRECMKARHPQPYGFGDESEDDDDDCSCRCHDELRQLEEDIWGPADV
jgi:hypothetical protein